MLGSSRTKATLLRRGNSACSADRLRLCALGLRLLDRPIRHKTEDVGLWTIGGSWPLCVPPGRLEERVEVLVDHAVQHRVLGIARPVIAGAERHRGDIGAPPACQQCPKMDTP
jgi:hypothetical protein